MIYKKNTMIYLPKSLTSGDTVNLPISLNKYSSANCDLYYQISGIDSLSVKGVANPLGGWVINFVANLTPGLYQWQSFVVSKINAGKTTIGTGRLTVLQNLLNVGVGYDPRTETEKTLAVINQAIHDLQAGGAVMQYEISGRKAQYYTLTELITLQSKYRILVANAKNQDTIDRGLPSTRNVNTRYR